MKKIYQAPTTMVVMLRAKSQLMSNSIAVGSAYQSGDAVLSRETDFSFDDDEE